MQLDSSNLEKETKKLKRYPKEMETLENIIWYIKLFDSYKDLKLNPMSRIIYGFEELKYSLVNYCSFRLEKNGVIRLIVKIDEEKNILKYEFISMDHYKDFKRKLKEN